MKPILYESTELDFGIHNGLGILSDVASCVVTEERNGAYELEMTYPTGGIHFDELLPDRILYVKAHTEGTPQAFRIYKLSKPMRGLVSVFAQHISYDLTSIAVSPFSADGVAGVFDAFSSNSVVSNPFSFFTDLAAGGNYQIRVPVSIRAILGGSDTSILETYGGEYEFDNLIVKLLAQRGRDTGVVIRYGKNMTALDQDIDTANVITAVYPYYTSEEKLVTLPEKIVQVVANPARQKVAPLDLTKSFETPPSVAMLRAAAEAYVANANLETPLVSVDVSFAQLEGETLGLCDIVSVEFADLGVSLKAKVVKTVYDALLDRYTSIEVGDIKSTIAGTIATASAEAAAVTNGVVYREADASGNRTAEVRAGIIRLDSTTDGVQNGTQIWRSSIAWYENNQEVTHLDCGEYGFRFFAFNSGVYFYTGNGEYLLNGNDTVKFGISAPPTTASATNARLNQDGSGYYILSEVTSARRYKKNINDIDETHAAEVIAGLRPITYEPNNDHESGTFYGFIAEEVENVEPLLCDYKTTNGEREVQSVQYDRFTAVIIKELQRLNKKIEELENASN